MIPSLVEAKPRTLSGLTPWESLRERLEDQNPRTLRALLEVVTRDLIDGMHPHSFGIREQYLGVKGERIEELLKAALMIGTIRAFAADPIRDKASALKMFAWGPVPLTHHDPYGSINSGVFLVDGSVYPAGSLDRRLANAPLFVVEKQVNAWFKLLPPSTASLRRDAETLVADHQRDHPSQTMRRQDFLDAIKKHHPLASGRQLKLLWRETAPEAWKRPGTKAACVGGQSDR